jgi:hypothetical protein
MFDTDWLSTLQMAPECLFADHLGPKAQSLFRHLISTYSVPLPRPPKNFTAGVLVFDAAQ